MRSGAISQTPAGCALTQKGNMLQSQRGDFKSTHKTPTKKKKESRDYQTEQTNVN